MKVPKTKSVTPSYTNGRWIFPEQMDVSGKNVGFIYIIRDNILKRFYLGKKHYRVMRGVNKGRISNWKMYVSSSKLLKEIWEHRGMAEFDFFCLEEYSTKGGLSYAETWTLCHVEAPTTLDWYNTRIEKVSWNVKEPVSDFHKQRLDQIMNFEI